MILVINDCIETLSEPYGLNIPLLEVTKSSDTVAKESFAVFVLAFVITVLISLIVSYVRGLVVPFLSIMPFMILFVSMNCIPDMAAFILCVIYILGNVSYSGKNAVVHSFLGIIITLIIAVICMIFITPDNYVRSEKWNDYRAVLEGKTGFSQLFTGTAVGGINNGVLGRFDKIEYSGQKVFTLNTKNEGIVQYYPLFIGKNINDSKWSVDKNQESDNKKYFYNIAFNSSTFRNILGKNSKWDYANELKMFRYTITPSRYGKNGIYFYTDMTNLAKSEEIFNINDVVISDYNIDEEKDLPSFASYKTMESSYRDYVYSNYLDVPDNLKDTLTDIFGEIKTNKISYINNVIRKLGTYKYTLAPGKLPEGKDFTQYFLTESKEGYCCYFATAAVLAFRNSGIPARYVEGYAIPEEQIKNGRGESYKEVEVYDYNAHAWAEVYFDGYGWITVEATPQAIRNAESINQGEESIDEVNTKNDSPTQSASQTQGDINNSSNTDNEVSTPVENQTQDNKITEDKSTEKNENRENNLGLFQKDGKDGENENIGKDSFRLFLRIIKINVIILGSIVSIITVIYIRYLIIKKIRYNKFNKLTVDNKKYNKIAIYQFGMMLNLLGHIDKKWRVLSGEIFDYEDIAEKLKEDAYFVNVCKKVDTDISRLTDFVEKAAYAEGNISVSDYFNFEKELLKIRKVLLNDIKTLKRLYLLFIFVL